MITLALKMLWTAPLDINDLGANRISTHALPIGVVLGAGTSGAEMANHLAALDPHGQYALETDVTDALALKVNNTDIGATSGATTGAALVGYSPGGTGTGGEVTNVQKALRAMRGSYLVEPERWNIVSGDLGAPPYSEVEYAQAYNNNVGFTSAIQYANEQGYSEVLFPRGDYCFIYTNLNTMTYVAYMPGCIDLEGIHDIDVNLNGSVLRVIFDSNNRNPYDHGTIYEPRDLSGRLIRRRFTSNVDIKNGELIGDMYLRSFYNPLEKRVEQTYGVFSIYNCFNCSETNLSIHGFAGDSISGSTRGYNSVVMQPWDIGGFDDATGAPVIEAGSYRTQKIDLTTFTVYRNAVQLATSGYTRAGEFKDERLSVFFYDTNNVFISSEFIYQTFDITLPKNCRYVAFVCYKNTVNTATATFGTLVLVSGSSFNQTIKNCRIYDNHRGGISNIPGGTVIDNCDIFDNAGSISGPTGNTKQGWPVFPDSTRYGINVEDVYVRSLTIMNSRLRYQFNQILCLSARHLHLSGNEISTSGSAGVYYANCSKVSIIGNRFEDIPLAVSGSTNSSLMYNQRNVTVSGNTFSNSGVFIDATFTQRDRVLFSDNIMTGGSVRLRGPIVAKGNTYTPVGVAYSVAYETIGAILTDGESVRIDPHSDSGYRYVDIANQEGEGRISVSSRVEVRSHGFTKPAATATLTSGVVSKLTLSSGGLSYATAPVVTLIGGSPLSSAVVLPVLRNGVVVELKVIDGGSGYTSTPTVSFSAPNGIILEKNVWYSFDSVQSLTKTIAARTNNWESDHLERFSYSRCNFTNAILDLYATTLTGQFETRLVWSKCEFFTSRVRLYRNESAGYGSPTVLTFRDCEFDVTSITSLVYNTYELDATLTISFENCIIRSDTAKNFTIFTGWSTNVTSTLHNCTLINVTNTDGITYIA